MECPEYQACECWVHTSTTGHTSLLVCPMGESSGALLVSSLKKGQGSPFQQELSFLFSDSIGGVFFFPHKLRSLDVCILSKQFPSKFLALLCFVSSN